MIDTLGELQERLRTLLRSAETAPLEIEEIEVRTSQGRDGLLDVVYEEGIVTLIVAVDLEED